MISRPIGFGQGQQRRAGANNEIRELAAAVPPPDAVYRREQGGGIGDLVKHHLIENALEANVLLNSARPILALYITTPVAKLNCLMTLANFNDAQQQKPAP